MPTNLRLFNVQWHEDSDGWYWTADLWKGDHRIGMTGNFYDRDILPWDTY